ncbi:hypothetical protein EGW08_009769 [Elysia chlorotica]|uniref:RING-type E3 ubiquitin transferase n=1 Tax=Elysia chlorotica TaxID=188477 RepID=A0A3S0ZP55_ELYCH|nr:hypothetical protein EGW08_009769 [Elysia chlorotica]
MDEKQINELIECPVCLDRLDQHCKVLRCQHTFCRRCLDEILLTKNELRCPECRALVTESLDALPTNILVMRIIEGLKTKGITLHGYSNGGQAPPAPSRVVASSSFRREPPSHFSRQGSQPCARALYNYESDVPDDLSFKKGDIINLKRQIDDNWFQGEISGVVGHFPANFVQVIVPLLQMPQCKALYDFDLKDEGEKDCLSFKKNETLTVIRRVDENWIEGRKGDKIGIFPLVFVELNDSAKILVSIKSNRSILLHQTPLPSTPSTSSANPVTMTTTSSRAPMVPPTSRSETVSSVPVTPQRNTVAPSGPQTFPARPAVPALVVSRPGGSVAEVTATPTQVVSQQAAAAASEVQESSPAGSLTSSESSMVSASSSPGEHLAVIVPGDNGTQTSAEASSEVVSTPRDPSAQHTPADTPTHQNKRHSYTQPLPPTLPGPSPQPSDGAQQNRHSSEISLPPGCGLAAPHVASSVSSAPASISDVEVLTLDTPDSHSHAHLKAAPTSPKQKCSSSPTTALLPEGGGDPSHTLSAPVYTALYCYRPQKDDELQLMKGEQYTVTEKCQDGWFKGACLRTGQAGVFPGNYVHLNRHTSAFKPVHPNILNIRAKGPHASSPAHPGHDSVTSASSAVTGGGAGSGDSSQTPPPLLPRVAKLGAQRSKSPSVPAPLRSLSHPVSSSMAGSTGSSGRFHFLGSGSVTSSSTSPSSHLAGVSLSSKPSVPASSASGHHATHWSLSALADRPMPSLASIAAQPMPSLGSVAAMMATPTMSPPPNVVMAASHHSAAPQEKEKKEKKEKEKKGLGKLFAGKGKKNKTPAPTEPVENSSTMAVLCFDNVAHVRSGSYPADSSPAVAEMGGLLGVSHSRKASSFDAVNTVIPPVPAKPRQKPMYRERYCCVVPYPPQTEHELSLELGDIIHVHRKREDGWYKGTQERTGRTGLFPASFVEKL